ncbi:MAG: hypothetical protein OHK0036_09980 [Bacteroidia bacterium]
MKCFNIGLVIGLILFSGYIKSQNREIESNVCRSATKTSSEKNFNKGETRELKISDEDTIIVTPVAKMVIKKKDFYNGNNYQPSIQEKDSIIITPNYKGIIRKSVRKE